MRWPCYTENPVIMRRDIMRLNCVYILDLPQTLGPVVQSFVSLKLLLSPQFVNYFWTSKANTLSFFVENM